MAGQYEHLPHGAMDKQEEEERVEVAEAYADENEQHFVDYERDCRDQSVDAMKEIRRIQNDCWNVYNENEPRSYADKDEWQSRIVVPKPFGSVQYGASAVKKAFSPNYLSITKAKDKKAADFWQRNMDFQLNEQHAKFLLRFTDATTMALAVGQSQEMIPRWVRGVGLEYVLVEPWKIHRDPDAVSRDPQSGIFWIHQEYLDYFVLQQGEKNGRYFDVARVKEVDNEDPENPFMTKEAIKRRKAMIWDDRSNFRKMILTSEFWGIVLDPKGEMLLPRATYTVAGGRVIQKPKVSPYNEMRWPGIGFSPLPNLLRFDGRGLLEGILTIWEAMNNMMCLHHDYLQWVVNPPTEINVDALVDPNDVEMWPGKKYLVRDTISGQQVVRIIQRRSRTSDLLANQQHYDQVFQRGSLVTDPVQGLPGYRKDITYRESAMNLDQAMGVYALMGENIEGGAIAAIRGGQEIVEQYAGYDDYLELFTEDELREAGIVPNPESATGVTGVPDMNGSFHVSGIQALMRDNETLKAIKEIIIPLANSPRFAPFILPYETLKCIETRVNLVDEGVIVTEDQAKVIKQQQQEMLNKQIKTEEDAQEIEEAKGILEIEEMMEEGGEKREDGGRRTEDGGRRTGGSERDGKEQ